MVIREEIRIDEPLEKELKVLREEVTLMAGTVNERQSEVEYWKRRFEQNELESKHAVGGL